MKPWDIRREGRAWVKGEGQARWELTPERLEMIDGKLLWDEEQRINLLGLLLENVGADAAVRLGDPAVWMEAVQRLRLEGEVAKMAATPDPDLPSDAEGLPPEGRACAALLGRLMSDLSEDYWCAGWLIGLEFELWQAALGNKTWISAAEIAQLRYLSAGCGGWIVFQDGPPYRRYVALDEWQKQYDAWCFEKSEE